MSLSSSDLSSFSEILASTQSSIALSFIYVSILAGFQFMSVFGKIVCLYQISLNRDIS